MLPADLDTDAVRIRSRDRIRRRQRRHLTDLSVSGWASLLVAVLFLGGVQLICLGILGAYLGRIYGEVKRRPLYLVKERLGFPPTGRPAVREEPADE